MKTRRLLRLLPALVVLALSMALVACNTSEDKANLSEGQPVQLGDLQYNVVFSRVLNPNDVEDHGYLVGQPAPKPDQLYLGVFVQIVNKNKNSPVTVPSGWTITDTDHNRLLPAPQPQPLRPSPRVADRARGPGARPGQHAAGRADRGVDGPLLDPRLGDRGPARNADHPGSGRTS